MHEPVSLVKWHWWGKNWSSWREKPCPTTDFSTINPLSTGVGRNLGFHGERPATNRVNHGTVSWNVTPCSFVVIYQTLGVICCCYYHKPCQCWPQLLSKFVLIYETTRRNIQKTVNLKIQRSVFMYIFVTKELRDEWGFHDTTLRSLREYLPMV
jgi:hypothetical protein